MITKSFDVPAVVQAWIDTKPYLLNGAAWFAWYAPKNQPNNSSNGDVHNVLRKPFPGMLYFTREAGGWRGIEPAN